MVFDLDKETYHSGEVRLVCPISALDLQMTMRDCFDNHIRGSVIDTMHNVLEFYDNPLFLAGAGIRRLDDYEMGCTIDQFIDNYEFTTKSFNASPKKKHFNFIVNVTARPLPKSST